MVNKYILLTYGKINLKKFRSYTLVTGFHSTFFSMLLKSVSEQGTQFYLYISMDSLRVLDFNSRSLYILTLNVKVMINICFGETIAYEF